MDLQLIFVGKTNFPEIEAGIGRYLERLRHYLPTRVQVVKAEKITRKISEEKVQQLESERIVKVVPPNAHLAVWDRTGKELNSIGFARSLQRLRDHGTPHLCMVIGGPLGVSSALLERASSVLSLSRMTFPHDLARLLVVEQIYRAFTILEGTPYHK